MGQSFKNLQNWAFPVAEALQQAFSTPTCIPGCLQRSKPADVVPLPAKILS
jgi:hypothetical protein